MKKVALSLILTSVLFACNSGDTSNTASKKQEKKENTEQADSQNDVVPNRLLTMEVEGMVCQMGCGGSMRKALNETGGVESCEFDFEEERKVDIAKIKFDKSKITVDEIVKVVSELNDGQFVVVSTSSEDYFPATSNEDETSSKSENSKVEISTSSKVHIPNVFDLFSGLLSF